MLHLNIFVKFLNFENKLLDLLALLNNIGLICAEVVKQYLYLTKVSIKFRVSFIQISVFIACSLYSGKFLVIGILHLATISPVSSLETSPYKVVNNAVKSFVINRP